MPFKNIDPIVASIHTKAYVIFNTDPSNKPFRNGDEVPMHCCDIVTGKWTELKPLPDALRNTQGAKAVGAGENIYLVGGLARICASFSSR